MTTDDDIDDLRPEYDFDDVKASRNRLANQDAAEVSFDLVMEHDMTFVEGTFRIPGGDWQVFIVSKREVTEAVITSHVWESGTNGVVIHVPRTHPLNKATVETLLASESGVMGWKVVRGPDSMTLR